MRTGPPGEPADALVLFGVTGDLARKKLFPALYALAAEGRLDMPVIGVARSDWTVDELRDRVRDAVLADRGQIDDDVFGRLVRSIAYVSGDYRAPETFAALREELTGCARPVCYLAIPPFLFGDVAAGLVSAGCSERGRLVLEKPFGRDLASARELTARLHEHWDEGAIYRIDHFLGKEAVQNLLVYRFANTFLEPIWNRHYVRGVQVTLAEDFGVEGRGGFYDEVGALRDVVQNHLLQVVSLLAMEPPVSEHPDALRDERVKLFRSVRSLERGALVRGQFAGYRDEPGIADGSDTETYAAVRLDIDSWRWAGVPFLVRAGKALRRTVTEAVIELDQPPRLLFADDECEPGPNRLRFRMKPDDVISLTAHAKLPGGRMVSRPVDLAVDHGEALGTGPDAYERLLGDALAGDQALFARADGVEEAWRIVDPVLEDRDAVHPYDPGSWGPAAADSLLPSGWGWIEPGGVPSGADRDG